MRVSNKIIYAILSDIQAELEVLRDNVEDINAKIKNPVVKDLDKPKRGRGRPKKVA